MPLNTPYSLLAILIVTLAHAGAVTTRTEAAANAPGVTDATLVVFAKSLTSAERQGRKSPMPLRV